MEGFWNGSHDFRRLAMGCKMDFCENKLVSCLQRQCKISKWVSKFMNWFLNAFEHLILSLSLLAMVFLSIPLVFLVFKNAEKSIHGF
jgi:hypothetical protein